jgi:glycosyltransferase involved in cell wall biosynthesis
MNILFVGTLPPHPGGSGIVNYQVLGGLARAGHKVRALAPDTRATQNRGQQFDAQQVDIAVRRYFVPHFEIPPYFPYPGAYIAEEQELVENQFVHLIQQDRPDIVLIGRETYARYVPDLCVAEEIACSLIIHGGLTHGIVDGTHPPETARRLLAQYRKIDLLITPGKHMATKLEKLGVSCQVIPNPVDMTLFTPLRDIAAFRSDIADKDDVVVAYLGHLRPLKRPLDLIHIAEAALRQDPRLKFVIVGDGPLQNIMQDACRRKQITNRFHFAGWVEHHAVPAYISAADIVITPTEAENQALIYLEAQACGRLLLATDIPAAREVIVDGETGLLFPVGDVSGCVEKLLLAASDPELRATIGYSASLSVRRHATACIASAYSSALRGFIKTDE